MRRQRSNRTRSSRPGCRNRSAPGQPNRERTKKGRSRLPMSDDTRHTLHPLFDWRSAICDSDLEPISRHVALTLSLHMSVRGDSCFPSMVTLAGESGLDERTVRRHIRALRESGWISVRLGGGRGRSNHYSASIPKGGHTDTLSSERGALVSLKGGAVPPESVIRASRSARVSDSNFQVRPNFTQRGGCPTCTQGWVDTDSGLERCPDRCWA